MRDVSRDNRGFTLVELLVSLAVLGMAAGLLMSGVASGQGLWHRAETRAADGEAVAAAQMVLRNRIEHLVPVPSFDGSAPFADVRGTVDSLSFYAPPADADRPGNLQRYRLQRDEDGTLTLYAVDSQSSTIEINAPTVKGWRAIRLLDGVAGMELGYFGAAPPDGARRWRNRWQERPQPPELVRIRLVFDPADRRIWPDLIVRPVASSNAACTVDSFTGRCRGS